MTARAHPAALAPAAAAAVVVAAFPSCAVVERPGTAVQVLVPAAELPAVARFVRDDARLGCDSLMDIAGLDLAKYPGEKKGEFPSDQLVAVYLLHSLRLFHRLTLRVQVPRTDPAIPTVAGIWPAAGLFEREIFDLFGIVFAGHGDLRRLLTPEDWTGHPLRKDYAYPATYRGVGLKRAGQIFEDGPYA